MSWRDQFPDFPAADIPADIPAAWRDKSWRYDACPSWLICGHALSDMLSIFIDEAEPSARSWGPDGKRFSINLTTGEAEQSLFVSDDWAVTLETAERFRLGMTFALILAREMTPEQWRQMRVDNRTIGKGICASHDTRDANMDMEQAFNEVFGAFFNGEGHIPQLCADRWNQAWDFAKERFLTSDDEGEAFDRWRETMSEGADPSGEFEGSGFVYAPGFISRHGAQFHCVVSNIDDIFPHRFQAEQFLWAQHARSEGGRTAN
jgi:hypothetical protein